MFKIPHPRLTAGQSRSACYSPENFKNSIYLMKYLLVIVAGFVGGKKFAVIELKVITWKIIGVRAGSSEQKKLYLLL